MALSRRVFSSLPALSLALATVVACWTSPALAVDPRAIVIVRPLQGPPLSAYQGGVKAVVVGMERVSPHANQEHHVHPHQPDQDLRHQPGEDRRHRPRGGLAVS